MKESTEKMLEIAQEYCDQEDKSTEFMIAYMADFADVDEETVIEYLAAQAEDPSHDELYPPKPSRDNN
jgi:hypothetical protein